MKTIDIAEVIGLYREGTVAIPTGPEGMVDRILSIVDTITQPKPDDTVIVRSDEGYMQKFFFELGQDALESVVGILRSVCVIY